MIVELEKDIVKNPLKNALKSVKNVVKEVFSKSDDIKVVRLLLIFYKYHYEYQGEMGPTINLF